MTLATNAAYYRAAAQLLTDWGWGEFINWYSGWDKRTNGSTIRTPSAVTVHHTGGTATATSYLVNPTDRPKLKVLANIHVDQLERKIRFICAGSASHGGYTYKPSHDRIVAGTAPLDRDLVPGADSPPGGFSINTYTVGIEVDGAGGAGEWNDWTYRATVAVTAALHIAAGWPVKASPRVGAHKEHTHRKPGDPTMSMGTFRQAVLDCIKTPWRPTVAAEPPKLGSRVLSKRAGQDFGPDVAELGKLLAAKGFNIGTPVDVFGPAMDAAVRTVQKAAHLPQTGVVDAATLTVILGQQNPSQPDGGSPTPEVPPVPEPVPALKAVMLLGVANCQSYGGDRSQAAWEARGKKMAAQNRNVWCINETSAAGRKVILAELGDNWAMEELVESCVMYRTDVFKARDSRSVRFGKPPTPFGHGAIKVPLLDLASGIGVDVISHHTRPGDIATGDQKDADIAAGSGLAGKWPAVFAGDLARNAPRLPGWVRVTPNVDTMDEKGDQRVDSAWTKGRVTAKNGRVVDPGKLSDHKWLTVDLTISPAPSTL